MAVFDKNQDVLFGFTATAGGSAGLFVQWMTNYGSALVIAANLLLAVGGLYLLCLRIVKARRDLQTPRQ